MLYRLIIARWLSVVMIIMMIIVIMIIIMIVIMMITIIRRKEYKNFYINFPCIVNVK